MNKTIDSFGRRALQLAATLALVACAADGAPDGPTPAVEDDSVVDAELLDRIGALGFDSSTTVRRGNLIQVEGDIILDLDKLLAGEYGRLAELGDDGVVEKGYRTPGKVNSTNDGNIKLVLGPEAAGIPGIVTGAVVAGASWSTDSSLDIRTSNTGPSIQIIMVDGWPCSSGQLACALFPSDGKPGAFIFVRRDIGCAWNAQIATFVLSHEMGHAIGMAHPLTGDWISGTSGCDIWILYGLPPTICIAPGIAPYDTIMDPTEMDINWNNCTVADPYLGFDDQQSVSHLYPGS